MRIHRINLCKRWSDITVFNGIGAFTEITDSDTGANIKSQVKQIFEQVEVSLALIDSDKSKVLAVTIYITDFANFEDLSEIRDEWFPRDCASSRACVKAELANPQLLVEMAFTVAAGEKYES